MNKHLRFLNKSTNTIRWKKLLAEIITLAVYCLVWATCVLSFYMGLGVYPLDYGILMIYIVMPAITLISSAIIGGANFFGRLKWIFCPIFGVMFMLVPYVTFTARNMHRTGNMLWPSWEFFIAGLIISAFPMAIAAAVRYLIAAYRSKKIAGKGDPSEPQA